MSVAWLNDDVEREKRLEKLHDIASKLEPDELDLVIQVAEGALTGQTRYGGLKTTMGSDRVWTKEALEEIRDGLFYLGVALMKAKDG